MVCAFKHSYHGLMQFIIFLCIINGLMKKNESSLHFILSFHTFCSFCLNIEIALQFELLVCVNIDYFRYFKYICLLQIYSSALLKRRNNIRITSKGCPKENLYSLKDTILLKHPVLLFKDYKASLSLSVCLSLPVFSRVLFLKLSWLLRFKICYHDGVSTASA